MFMEIAIGAIGIGIVLMVGYLVIAQVRTALPTPLIANPCLGLINKTDACNVSKGVIYTDNTSASIVDTSVTTGLNSTQATVFAGFGLIAVGIIVLAAFGLINVFR
jgi:hypothetical protein